MITYCLTTVNPPLTSLTLEHVFLFYCTLRRFVYSMYSISISDRKATSRAFRSSNRAIRSCSDRPRRSSLQPISTSPGCNNARRLVIGRHAFPRTVEFTNTLPKTPSGKIQRLLWPFASASPKPVMQRLPPLQGAGSPARGDAV
jgi:acyl-CoA synthetase (AMP-forming)/AMP-acid ligase II